MSAITLPYNLDLQSRSYQREVLLDERKNKVLVIHRRAGKTSLALAKVVMEAIINPNKIYYYACPTQRQAKQVVWTAPDMIKKLVPPEAILKTNEVDLIIYLKNGSQIHIKGADNPDSWRGVNPYGVVLDEYSQMKPEIYDEILLPILLANGGWVWFLGTPKGKDHFYDRFNIAQNKKGWQALLLPASHSGILSSAILEEARLSMTEQAFSQEFECAWVDGVGVLFRRINENIKDTLSEPMAGRQYAMGVDLARIEDWTVITVLDRTTHEIVYYDRFNQIDWQLQKSRIEAVARRYNNAKIKLDATGVGDPIYEDLKRVGLTVEPIKFTAQNKKQIVDNLIIAFENDKIKIPHIPEMVEELQSYTYTMSESTGHVRYSAPSGKHDDIVISLALAFWGEASKVVAQSPMQKFNFKVEYDKWGMPSIK